MTSSTKFKILFDLYRHAELRDYLLRFYKAQEVDESLFNNVDEFILRSALYSENDETLNSGVSLSIKNIKTYEDFKMAKEQVDQQKDLDFAIVQPYWNYEKHITLILENEKFYADVIGEKSEFILKGPMTSTGDKKILKPLLVFIDLFKKYVKEAVILELGFSKGQLKLFQVSLFKDNQIKKFVYQELFQKIMSIQDKLANRNLFQKFKTELKAKRFRESNPLPTLGNILENWFYLFHYYGVYCVRSKERVGQASFESFLKELNSKNHILSLAKWHVVKANEYRVSEDLPQAQSFFSQNSNIYLGCGVKEYTYEQDCIWLEDLSFSNITENKNSLILSTYNAILGHPCLFMAQESIDFVGGLSRGSLSGLKQGDKISVDFNSRKIEIKSI